MGSLRKKTGLIVISVLTLLLVLITLVLVILVFRSQVKDDNEEEPHRGVQWPAPSHSVLGEYTSAAVASDNGLCAEVGRNLMIQGGSAVDAIIGTNICQGALNSHSSGLGGGFLLAIYNRTSQTCHTVNARETAPQLSNETMFVNKSQESTTGWLSIAVPGEVSGMWAAHESFGRLPWGDLFLPTIDLLEQGFPVSGALAKVAAASKKYLTVENGLDFLINPATRRPYKQGEIAKRPKLASTLKLLATSANPRELFYEKDIAMDIVQEISEGGGILSLEDMQGYITEVKNDSQSVVVHLTGSNLVACGPQPPSSAAAVIALLNIIDGYEYNPEVLKTAEQQTLFTHRLIEAMKFVYGGRSELGDIDFVDKAAEAVKNLTSADWAAWVRSRITDKAHAVSYYGGDMNVKFDHGTTHMTAIDSDGNVASLSGTINLYFGSKRASKKYGIIFNDQMDDFSTPGKPNSFGIAPSPENFIKPGKRPQSSMSPLVVYDIHTGEPRLAIGASGGVQIISAVGYIAMRVLLLNETIKEAIDAPRLHNQLIPNITFYEAGFPREILDGLVYEHGQAVKQSNPYEKSVCSGISKRGNTIYANSDYRKTGGYPAGY